MKKKNKYLRLLLAIGILILIITPFATVAYGTNWKALYIDIPTEIEGNPEEGSVLEFEIHDWTVTHFLRIYLAVQPMIVGPQETPPLLSIIMVDQANMTMFENEQNITYAYFSALGIENSTYFDVRSLNQSGKYYLIIYNAIPYNTTGLTTIVEGWTGWAINPLFYPLMALGVCVTIPILLLPRIKRRR